MLTVEGTYQCVESLFTSDATSGFDACVRQLIVGRRYGIENKIDSSRAVVVIITQPTNNIGLGIILQFWEDLDDLCVEGGQLQFVGQSKGIGANVSIGILQTLEQETCLFRGFFRSHFRTKSGDFIGLFVN